MKIISLLRKNIKKVVVYLSTLFIIGMLTVAAFFYYMNTAPSSLRTVNITIEKGMTLRSAATYLKKNNIIRSKNIFVLFGYIFDKKSILSGRYRIYDGSTNLWILDKLTTGQILTRRVTIPEGYNIYQMANNFQQANICDSEEFIKFAKNASFLKSIGISAAIVEGYLYPDTYVFAEGSDPRDVIIYMKKKMDSEIKSIISAHGGKKGTDLSKHKMLTLASIIEKEAVRKNERKKISAVFYNRMKKGWRFDSCATVWYAIGKYEGGHLTKTDLKVNSPYNTYLHTGFPPTPIASPGRGSLEAAMYPDKTPYMFFVSRNDGSHYFSTTLRRHNQAVDYYQKGIRNGFKDEQR